MPLQFVQDGCETCWILPNVSIAWCPPGLQPVTLRMAIHLDGTATDRATLSVPESPYLALVNSITNTAYRAHRVNQIIEPLRDAGDTAQIYDCYPALLWRARVVICAYFGLPPTAATEQIVAGLRAELRRAIRSEAVERDAARVREILDDGLTPNAAASTLTSGTELRWSINTSNLWIDDAAARMEPMPWEVTPPPPYPAPPPPAQPLYTGRPCRTFGHHCPDCRFHSTVIVVESGHEYSWDLYECQHGVSAIHGNPNDMDHGYYTHLNGRQIYEEPIVELVDAMIAAGLVEPRPVVGSLKSGLLETIMHKHKPDKRTGTLAEIKLWNTLLKDLARSLRIVNYGFNEVAFMDRCEKGEP